ncbi:hypothetical protein HU200_000753 [Digitaria exilis]|uniref:Uncharacterized protein n=1 Tax=Digitaria exilis TaxID=1010633 RepID=A0A835L0E5_9POAL|nr:hypothetical protein HU200_000753 [Digitaria exilis]
MMQAFLKVASAHPEVAVRSDTVRTWVKQVRDLAYDVEDCLLDFALYADRTTTSSRPGSSWLPSALAQRRRIAAPIRYLKARFEELNQRNLRYNIAVKPAGAEGSAAQQAPVLPDNGVHSHELPFKPIGRQDDKDELTKLIITRLEPDIIHEEDQVAAVTRGNGAVSVVSVWGMGGMGKSSLVRMVHNDPNLLDEFDCSAWVTVPHPLDSPEVFRQRLRAELGVAHDQDLVEYLQEKRYLVIVDDLLSQDEWENICQVFQFDNNMGSRIIVTTGHKDVARHCEWQGLDYELKPLGDRESKNLFFQKVRALIFSSSI